MPFSVDKYLGRINRIRVPVPYYDLALTKTLNTFNVTLGCYI